MLDDLQPQLADSLGLGAATQRALLTSLIIVAVIWLLRFFFLRLTLPHSADLRTRYRLRKISAYFGFVLAVLLVGRLWVAGLRDLATFFGLLSAGIAIALRDPLVSIAAWFHILWRRPFEVGDRIAIGQHAGDVIDLRLFRFSMLEIGNWVAADQSTGRVLHVPNSLVFTETVANYTKEFAYIWEELPVLVTFESNWRDAKAILERIADTHAGGTVAEASEAVKKAADSLMIFYTTLTPRVWTSVADSGVLLTLRYLCPVRRRRSSAEAIWEAILDELGKRSDIDFAYPTIRRFDHRLEGKEAIAAASGAATTLPQPDGPG